MSVGKFQNGTGGRTDTMTRGFQHSSRGRKGNPEVLLWCYLHFVSIPLLAICGWAGARTHTHTRNAALTCANHAIKRATNDCLHFFDECVGSWALMCECVLTSPGISSRCFGNRGQSCLTQLKTVYYT